MGNPILSSLLELLAKEKCDFSNPLWRKLSLELQSSSSNRNPSPPEMQIRRSRRCMVMKRRARLDRCIRPINAIERKVRILKKLIPNSEYMGVETLFRETADYIVALQMRAKAMQIMVDALSASADE
ncbi:hypothetical protein ABFX02_04G005700 [Erythranthe guttata]